jgi:hypothetical protein
MSDAQIRHAVAMEQAVRNGNIDALFAATKLWMSATGFDGRAGLVQIVRAVERVTGIR